jgi:flagellar biosynthesis protein
MGKVVRKKAAALAYDPTKDDSPRVTAQGKGKTAQRIVDAALEHGVPIREDAALADALMQAQIGGYVAEELYQAVAEVLAFVWMLEKKTETGKDKNKTNLQTIAIQGVAKA